MQAQREHTAFKRIIGGGFPLYRHGEDHVAFENNLQAKGRVMQQAGITHVQINGGLVSARRAQDPENSYLMWAVPGQTMDEIVSSDYTRGILPESILELNRNILKQNAAYARQFGFKPIVWFVEPYFMPESFYQRWPDLRGPRVDNPNCSRKPLFAPCVALPKVQDHYRQLARNLLRLAPGIEQIHVFTNDSGAGICYSRYLYPGSNGPGHCRDISPARHVSLFLNAILEGAREVNPKARVIMECGLHPAETRDLADLLPSEGSYHWILATAHTIRGTAFKTRLSLPNRNSALRPWRPYPMGAILSLSAIIARDIANERKLALARNHHKPAEETPRARVMRRHQRDRARVVDLGAFESKRPAGWKGAVASFEV